MKKIFLILVFAIPLTGINAQRIAIYFDYKNSLFIFDDGVYKELENTPVTGTFSGSDFVAYFDHDGYLKYYYKGQASVIEEFSPQDIKTSENFLVYKMRRGLYKVEKGNKSTLCEWANDYKVGDSIIAFTDYGDTAFKVYYNGKISTLESGVKNGDVRTYSVSANMVLWTDGNNDLKTWWHGKTYSLGKTTGIVGIDIAVFSNGFELGTRIFYRGQIIPFDAIGLKSYQVGNGLFAYVDRSGNFSVFYNGESQFILSHTPTNYSVQDNFVFITDGNDFCVFYKGKKYFLYKLSDYDSGQISGNATYTIIGNFSPIRSKTSFTFQATTTDRFSIFCDGVIKLNLSFEEFIKSGISNEMFEYTDPMNNVQFFYKGKLY